MHLWNPAVLLHQTSAPVEAEIPAAEELAAEATILRLTVAG
eukprot:COSAG06_NODE_58001_length_278_cov_0.871508_1_plen_40_part_10